MVVGAGKEVRESLLHPDVTCGRAEDECGLCAFSVLVKAAFMCVEK